MHLELSVAVHSGCKVGESPVWHPDEACLYWTDIPNGVLHRLDPATGAHTVVYEGDMIGGLTIQADGSLLLFMEAGAVRRFDGGTVETIQGGSDADTVFNDVIADPLGGVFCGKLSMETGTGSLWRLDTDGELTEVLGAVGTPNGMGFAPGQETFYVTDSRERRIERFDYDRSTGAISGGETFADFADERVRDGLNPDHYPVPDGMTVDSRGRVWTCLFGGDGVVRLSPSGAEIGRAETPVSTTTSLAFGGERYRDLYLTTGWLAHADTVPETAGSVFRGRIDGVHGVPEFRSSVLI